METERIVNISELEALHRSLYCNAIRLREESEKESPSMIVIDELSRMILLDAVKAKDFEFCLERRTVNVSNA